MTETRIEPGPKESPKAETGIIGPGITLVRAPNASAMTHTGTNTYLLGEARLIVLDPGPADPRHLAALLAAIGGRPVEAVVVGHAHADHAGLASTLARAVGAPVLAHGGGHGVGQGGAGHGGAEPEEGDWLRGLGLAAGPRRFAGAAIAPDVALAEGSLIAAEGGAWQVLHTPGHAPDHICLLRDGVLLSGDHVMAWSSSVIAPPPDGDMGAFMAGLARLARLPLRRALPGHGPAHDDPAALVARLIAHRRAREEAILAALDRLGTPADGEAVTRAVYPRLAPGLEPMARLTCLAHLAELARCGRVSVAPEGPAADPDGTAPTPLATARFLRA
ncbi:MAG: MBL fold metallo-hydrolase [Rubellimicrobium sp.]|nr:MBL fold metallo-hydrolase [Rubellimicrobium sp.]